MIVRENCNFYSVVQCGFGLDRERARNFSFLIAIYSQYVTSEICCLLYIAIYVHTRAIFRGESDETTFAQAHVSVYSELS